MCAVSIKSDGMKTLILFISFVILIGCSQFGEPQKLEKKPVVQEVQSAVQLEATFASIKTHILDVKCIRCHSANSSSRGKKIPFDTEEQIINGSTETAPLINFINPAESVFYRATVRDEKIRGDVSLMPPKTTDEAKMVSPEEQQVIFAWISGRISGSASNPE